MLLQCQALPITLSHSSLMLVRVRLPCLLSQPQAAAPATKGFGAPAKKVKKEKSAGQIEREKAASAYDNLAASGIPEYNIFVKIKVSLPSEGVLGTVAVVVHNNCQCQTSYTLAL
jgi:Family of unknown function (DUF6523)